MINQQPHTNALIHESSPYLLQHAHNPVNWLPWGEKAFEKAQKENKLMIISIGYAACHWCHVMEKECFEDMETAQIMNRYFVCVKVDREERPDVDNLYMEAVQILTGTGGWPLNCFVLPNGKPFYGGTYFPKSQWIKVLLAVAKEWELNPLKIEQYAENLSLNIHNNFLTFNVPDNEILNLDEIHSIVVRWAKEFDQEFGGENSAPKFPLPVNLSFLINFNHYVKDKQIDRHIRLTLIKMGCGGIYDHTGGGFARYSTDKRWKVPHFEKMLYDNAQLISLYAQAYRVYGDEFYRSIIEKTCSFIQKEMTSEEGAFFSAIDADSEGKEGKYYVWTEEELKTITGKDFDWFKEFFNIHPKEKWEGNYVLHADEPIEVFASNNGYDANALRKRLEIIMQKLYEKRNARKKPLLDDKILTSWNALMIMAYLDAYEVVKKDDYLQCAQKAYDFLIKYHTQGPMLYHTFNPKKKKGIQGMLEDYALFINMLIKFYNVTNNETLMMKAKNITDYTIQTFYDEKSGFFYFSKAPELFAHKQEIYDNVIPSSNSIMAENLLFTGIFFSNSEYLKIAETMLQKTAPVFAKYPQGMANWGKLMLKWTKPFYEVVISGPKALEWKQEMSKMFLPQAWLLGCSKNNDLPLFKERYNKEKTMIYICNKGTCKKPVESIEEALKIIL